MTSSTDRPRRTVVIGVLPLVALVAVASLLALSVILDDSDLTLDPETKATALASADFDPLGPLSALSVTSAVIEAQVTSTEGGAAVSLRDDGYVEYEVGQSGFPVVVLGRVKLLKVYDDAIGRGWEELGSSSEVLAYHSNGHFVEGRTYAFFLGRWSDSDFAILYAHDLGRDEPGDGFAVQAAPVLTRIQAGTEGSSASAKRSRLETVLELADELKRGANAEGPGPLEQLARGSLPGPEAETDESRFAVEPASQFPSEPEQLSPSDKDLIFADILIVATSGLDRSRYAVRAEGDSRMLGWFASGENDRYVLISGYLPRGANLSVLVEAESLDNPAISVFDGLRFPNISLPDDRDRSEASYLIDLRDTGNPIVREFENSTEFDSAIMELQPILDGAVQGPEPE